MKHIEPQPRKAGVEPVPAYVAGRVGTPYEISVESSPNQLVTMHINDEGSFMLGKMGTDSLDENALEPMVSFRMVINLPLQFVEMVPIDS